MHAQHAGLLGSLGFKISCPDQNLFHKRNKGSGETFYAKSHLSLVTRKRFNPGLRTVSATRKTTGVACPTVNDYHRGETLQKLNAIKCK